MDSELLRNERKKHNLSFTSVSLQTGLSKKIIEKAENSNQTKDEAILTILAECYNDTLLYNNWLSSLVVGEKVLLKETTVGTTNSFYYTVHHIKGIKKNHIVLDDDIELNKISGDFEYDAPNGMIFLFKIYPYTADINSSKRFEWVQKVIALFTTGGIL